ncbi:MAG: hypothetical protein SGBAC_003490 [Bacillariaceae sp.]
MLQNRMTKDARTLLDELRQHVKSLTVPYESSDIQRVWNPAERRMEVVQRARSLRVNNNNNNNNFAKQMMDQAQRKLAFTGHVWDACIPDSTPTSAEVTAKTYGNVEYDDQHDPNCICIFDNNMKELWMQCTMGDETCLDDGNGNTTSLCAETHEIFLFSTNTGDLSSKNTCHFCNDYTNTNCTGIKEHCSVVYFDDNETPQQCIFQDIMEDGTIANCDNCQICQDANGETGMNYDCFGKTTNGQCDTTESFHVHNFAPVLSDSDGLTPVGGRFGNMCKKNEEFAIYDKTTYDDPFGKVCDCDDPSSGVIVCDLFLDTQDCFANECSPISEIFYFGQNSGELTEKLTCDGTNGLCSRVAFANNGKPNACELILFPDPTPCRACSICQDETTNEYGIQFSCFGADQSQCLTSNGRAINNFVDQPTMAPGPASSPAMAPTSAPINDPSAVSNETRTIPEDSATPWGAILGAFLGGLVFALLVAYVCFKKRGRSSDDDSAGATPSVVEAQINNEDQDDSELKEVPQLT